MQIKGLTHKDTVLLFSRWIVQQTLERASRLALNIGALLNFKWDDYFLKWGGDETRLTYFPRKRGIRATMRLTGTDKETKGGLIAHSRTPAEIFSWTALYAAKSM